MGWRGCHNWAEAKQGQEDFHDVDDIDGHLATLACKVGQEERKTGRSMDMVSQSQKLG